MNGVLKFLLGGLLLVLLILVVTAISIVIGGLWGYAIFIAYNSLLGASLNPMLGAAIGSTVGLAASSSVANNE